VSGPLRNRVTPFGDIVATPARGTLYGNRGVLHDEARRVVRTWQVRRWIACRLEFKGWHRSDQMPPGRFTSLYFLDEATAFAAGHRPCAECRREDYRRFQEAWRVVHPAGSTRADDMDRVLQAERVAPGGSKRLHEVRLDELPNGAMVADDGAAWLVVDEALLRWTPFGYDETRPRRGSPIVRALTPPSLMGVIRAGFDPMLHPSTGGSSSGSV
jgi:hypothetical protein